MVKRIAILGSTGSIGKNALRVIDSLNGQGGDRYEVVGLTANRNVELLAEQVLKYKPAFAVIADKGCYAKLKELLAGSDTEVLAGAESLVTIASADEVDIVLSAIVGVAGLGAVLAGAKEGKRLAIANKEPLVVAGELLINLAKANGAEILPIDSEHCAVFQSLLAGRDGELERIILTTSGGPFRGFSKSQLEQVTLAQALDHPVWSMGPKITIDSSTMMNKALEVIEAKWLFDVPVEKVDVLVHPEHIIHSMVEFVDGSVIAQLGEPDMCLPIQYALTYPGRVEGIVKRLKLEDIGTLSFDSVDSEKFRSMRLCYEVCRAGGTLPAVFNGANEAAVELFLQGRIKFVDIVRSIEKCLEGHEIIAKASLEELLRADEWARKQVKNAVEQTA